MAYFSDQNTLVLVLYYCSVLTQSYSSSKYSTVVYSSAAFNTAFYCRQLSSAVISTTSQLISM